MVKEKFYFNLDWGPSVSLWSMKCNLSQHPPVSRRSWRCRHLCWRPSAGWCARIEKSWPERRWPDSPVGGCKKFVKIQCFFYGQQFVFVVFCSSCSPSSCLPEDVLTDGRESWDIFVVDDVRVQGRLRHQVGPCQWRVHQGVSWEIKHYQPVLNKQTGITFF